MSAGTKLELLGLLDGAVRDGWAHARACRVLGVADVRAHRWRQRLRETGSLVDQDPGGGAVHGILEWEEQAILGLIETWGPVDRSHRKLAHRGSYTGTVFVSPSTVLRVAVKHKVVLPGEPVRARSKTPVFPEIPWERNRIWIWDAVRREVFWSRAVVRDHRGGLVAAGSCKQRAVHPSRRTGWAVSSPVNDGTGQHCQMVRVRQARREGVRQEPASERSSR